MTCTGDYCQQKTQYIYFGRSLEESQAFQCLLYAAPVLLSLCACVQAALPASLPSHKFFAPDRSDLRVAAPAAELLGCSCKYLYVQSSCSWASKAAVFCSSENLLPPSLVLEYNLYQKLHF